MAQAGAQVVTLGGVVEHDVEDHLEPGRVEPLDHRLELGDLTSGASRSGGGRIGLVRCEVTNGVVAPVVGQPGGTEESLRHGLVHREQLDRGDAEPDEVLDDGIVGEPGVGSSLVGRYTGMQLGVSLGVQLVEDGVADTTRRVDVAAPVEGRVDDDAARHRIGRVDVARRTRVVLGVSEHARSEPHRAACRPGVRIEEQLGLHAAKSAGRIPRPGGRDSHRPGPARRRARRRATHRSRSRPSGCGVRGPRASKRHRSIPSATSDATAKFVPPGEGVAPSGNARPGRDSGMFDPSLSQTGAGVHDPAVGEDRRRGQVARAVTCRGRRPRFRSPSSRPVDRAEWPRRAPSSSPDQPPSTR